MSENERTPVRLDLSHVCTIPAGKSGKAAKKQLANEKKARMNKLRLLAKASSGDGLLVMLTAPDPKLCRYIMKKLGHVIPFYVRTHSDGKCPDAAREMSWLMSMCEERGMRTMWLDLAGAEKLDKKQVLCLVAGELIRVLGAPAPVKTVVVAEEPREVVEPEEEHVAEPEPVEETPMVAEEPTVELQEAVVPEEEPVEVTQEPVEPQEMAAPEEEPVVPEEPTAPEVEILSQETVVPEEVPAAETAIEPQEAVPEMAQAEKPAPAKRRTRKAAPKEEGETPAKPKRKRQPKAPLTVGETLARRRRQMGLEE